MGIKTVKELPSTYKKADDLYVDYDDNCSYVGLEGHPTEFNRDFYGLAELVEDHLCGEDVILRAVDEVGELFMSTATPPFLRGLRVN